MKCISQRLNNMLDKITPRNSGTLDKKLHVELQDYSIEAVKMIIATGGTVKKV